MNSKEILSFMKDIKSIVKNNQKGGFSMSGGGFAEEVINFGKMLIGLVIIFLFFVAVYYLYVFIFVGYPRIFFDIITFSFFKKADLDTIFTEQSFMITHFRAFAENADAMEKVLVNFRKDELLKNSKNLPKDIKDCYNAILNSSSKSSSDPRVFQTAFINYYLLFEKSKNADSKGTFQKYIVDILENGIGTDIYIANKDKGLSVLNDLESYIVAELNVPKLNDRYQGRKTDCPRPLLEKILTEGYNYDNCPWPITDIEYYDFYNTCVQILEQQGKLKFNKQISDQEKVAYLYLKEKYNSKLENETEYKYRLNVFTISSYIDKLKSMLINLDNELKTEQWTYYILFPDNAAKMSISMDTPINDTLYENAYDSILSNGIKSNKYKCKVEYSYVYYEMLYMIKNKDKLDSICNTLNNLYTRLMQSDRMLKYFGAVYVNEVVENKLLLKQKSPYSFDYSKDSVESLTTILDVFPIFSSLYFNDEIIDKSAVYRKIVKAYNVLFNTGDPKKILENWYANGINFKIFLNSSMVIKLYLVDYETEFKDQYMRQYFSNADFFKDLYRPYMHYLLEVQILGYYKRTMSTASINRQKRHFMKAWGAIGTSLVISRKMIGKAFSGGAEQPKEPDAIGRDPSGGVQKV